MCTVGSSGYEGLASRSNAEMWMNLVLPDSFRSSAELGSRLLLIGCTWAWSSSCISSAQDLRFLPAGGSGVLCTSSRWCQRSFCDGNFSWQDKGHGINVPGFCLLKYRELQQEICRCHADRSGNDCILSAAVAFLSPRWKGQYPAQATARRNLTGSHLKGRSFLSMWS